MSNARTAVAQTEKVALEWSISYNRAPDMGCIYVFYSLIFAEYWVQNTHSNLRKLVNFENDMYKILFFYIHVPVIMWKSKFILSIKYTSCPFNNIN